MAHVSHQATLLVYPEQDTFLKFDMAYSRTLLRGLEKLLTHSVILPRYHVQYLFVNEKKKVKDILKNFTHSRYYKEKSFSAYIDQSWTVTVQKLCHSRVLVAHRSEKTSFCSETNVSSATPTQIP